MNKCPCLIYTDHDCTCQFAMKIECVRLCTSAGVLSV